MSFGLTDAVVETHVAGLRRTRGAGSPSGSLSPLALLIDPYGVSARLRNRIGVGLVEAGLHFMVQARESAPPVPYGAAFLKRSSTARGR